MRAQAPAAAATLEAAVWAALDEVLDPELDEPITTLGFVASCDVGHSGAVTVRLRLPTYFCAPNFVFIMVTDARDALARIAGVTSVDVGVEDHFAAADINGGVADQRTFVETFGDLAESELDGVRIDFLRKAVLAATDRVCQPLRAVGHEPPQLANLTLADPPSDANLQRLRDRRRQLGLPADDCAPLLIDPTTGARVADDDVTMHLHRARLTRMSMETNSELCRSLLHRRYTEASINIRSHGTTERREAK
ncbi:MAG: iron-sulfur cluster assembly protein [Acidimicrobiales bacterium]